MKQQLIILASLFVFLITSCQNDNADVFVENPNIEDGVPVNVSFYMFKGLQIDNELVPMKSGIDTRGADENVIKTNISNSVKVILAKKINAQWVLADYFDHKIDPSEKWVPIYHNVRDTTVFHPIEMILTPGEYSITLITGVRSLNWNDTNLKKGMILTEGDNAEWACTYRLTDNGYINPGLPALQEEIFAGREEFEVKKTDDLHSNPFPNDVQLTLQRKVGRLRFMLKKRTSADPGTNVDYGAPFRSGFGTDNTQDFFASGYQSGISAKIRLTDISKKFSSGLNIWGEPQYNYYRLPESVTELYYSAFTWRNYYTGNDGVEYTLAMRNGTRQFGCNFFTKEGEDLPVEISDVRITFYSGGPAYEYDGEIDGISIKHNAITGLIFESGNVNWTHSEGQTVEGRRELLLVKDTNGDPVKSEDKFHNYYEVREKLPDENI